MCIFDLIESLNINEEREIKIENKRKREEKMRDEEHDVYGNKNGRKNEHKEVFLFSHFIQLLQ